VALIGVLAVADLLTTDCVEGDGDAGGTCSLALLARLALMGMVADELLCWCLLLTFAESCDDTDACLLSDVAVDDVVDCASELGVLSTAAAIDLDMIHPKSTFCVWNLFGFGATGGATLPPLPPLPPPPLPPLLLPLPLLLLPLEGLGCTTGGGNAAATGLAVVCGAIESGEAYSAGSVRDEADDDLRRCCCCCWDARRPAGPLLEDLFLAGFELPPPIFYAMQDPNEMSLLSAGATVK